MLAGVKRQRNLQLTYASGLLIVVLLDAVTSHLSADLRVDILHCRGKEELEAEKDSALDSLKRLKSGL